jgi:hypothetical protein
MLSNPGRTWNGKSWSDSGEGFFFRLAPCLAALACHQSMNSPDSRCQAVFRAHFFADGRSLLSHLCRSSGEDCTRQGGDRDIMDAPRSRRNASLA